MTNKDGGHNMEALRIELGDGLFIVSDGNIGGVPALIIMNGGPGVVGMDMPGNRYIHDGEEVVSIIFKNYDALTVVQSRINLIAEKMRLDMVSGLKKC